MISYNGQTYVFQGNYDPNPGDAIGPADNYSAPDGTWLEIDQSYEVLEMGGPQVAGSDSNTFDPYSGVFSNPALLALASNGQPYVPTAPCITVRSTYQISGMWNGGNWLSPDFSLNSNGTNYADFANPPESMIFQIDSSPYYIYTSGYLLIDESSGTWPPSNVMPNPPPQTIYVLDSGESNWATYSLQGVNTSGGANWYSEQDNYTNVTGAGQQVTLQRYYNNSTYSGAISGDTDLGNYFSGSFDPVAQQFSNISPPDIQVTLSSVGNGNRQGPLYISWDDTLLAYGSTDNSGNDYYGDSTGQWWVIINNGLYTYGSSPTYGGISGSYNTATSAFSVPDPDFFALDSNGNAIGLPTGLIVIAGSAGIANSIYLSNNQQTMPANANYIWQRPDGSWASEYVGLPSSYWFLIGDASNPTNYDSQVYVTADTSSQNQFINAVSGWPLSNAYPSQLYVNGVSCALQWGSNQIGGPGQMNGFAPYTSADGTISLTLSWSFDYSQFSWTWTMNSGQWNGDYGAFDGVSNFSNVPFGLTISLNPLKVRHRLAQRPSPGMAPS